MANTRDGKLRLLYVMEILHRQSDADHPINVRIIQEQLEEKGIHTERKSILRDIAQLREFGWDIAVERGRYGGVYLAGRQFQLPELKLMADAVAASKFITEKKSQELVHKLEMLGSMYEARQLQRQVVVSDRAKAENETVYYVVDAIHSCIEHNHQMTFQYTEWTAAKTRSLRKEGATYVVSPEFLLWDSEFYYLVAYDELAGQIRHYRVDRIVNAVETEEARGGAAERAKIKKSDYANRRFGMFAGKTVQVQLYCPSSMLGVMIDRFGVEIPVRKSGDGWIVRVEVEVSPQFFGWITGLSGGVYIAGPKAVAEEYRRYLTDILDRMAKV